MVGADLQHQREEIHLSRGDANRAQNFAHVVVRFAIKREGIRHELAAVVEALHLRMKNGMADLSEREIVVRAIHVIESATRHPEVGHLSCETNRLQHALGAQRDLIEIDAALGNDVNIGGTIGSLRDVERDRVDGERDLPWDLGPLEESEDPMPIAGPRVGEVESPQLRYDSAPLFNEESLPPQLDRRHARHIPKMGDHSS